MTSLRSTPRTRGVHAIPRRACVTVLDNDDWWAGSDGRPYARAAGVLDWYLFAHGHDYAGAVREYTLVGGAVPMLPRYTFGVWWTRWYDFTAGDVRDVVEQHRDRGIPLDVMVLDMSA